MATRRWASKAIWMRSGWLRASIYRVLLFWDRFSVSKPLSQIQRRTLLFLQQASYTPSFGGLGLRHWKGDRNSEIKQRFTERFSSFDDLKTVVVPILERNGRIFDSYGPTGDPSVDAMRHRLWLRFEGELIANNQKLEQILTANEGPAASGEPEDS